MSETLPSNTVTEDKRNREGETNRLLRYGAALVAVQLLLLVAATALAATPWFMDHDADPGLKNIGYSLRLRNADCDVLIYGDSTSLTGLDPAIIQQVTGLTACNISETVSVQGVVGSSFAIDHYLSQNKRPRFLLAMYNSLMFRPERPPFDTYQPEGVLYALQYDRNKKLYRKLLTRPDWLFKFGIWSAHAMVLDFLQHHFPGQATPPPLDYANVRAQRNGQFPFPVPPETKCMREDSPDSIGRYADSVSAMRSHYGVQGTQVILNLSPAAACDKNKAIYQSREDGLHDNPFEVLPISNFNEGDVHFSPEGSRHISLEAAQQILALEHQAPTQPAIPSERAAH